MFTWSNRLFYYLGLGDKAELLFLGFMVCAALACAFMVKNSKSTPASVAVAFGSLTASALSTIVSGQVAHMAGLRLPLAVPILATIIAVIGAVFVGMTVKLRARVWIVVGALSLAMGSLSVASNAWGMHLPYFSTASRVFWEFEAYARDLCAILVIAFVVACIVTLVRDYGKRQFSKGRASANAQIPQSVQDVDAAEIGRS